MGKLTVLDGGLLSSIQDEGRFGYRKLGVPVSGVLDIYSSHLANNLVGNPVDYPVIEFSLKGGKYKFKSDAVIAITGALMNPRLDSNEIKMNTSIQVKKNSILEIGYANKGMRAYLAIKGKWDISKVMGSYSTYLEGKFGGLNGRKLKKGDKIFWNDESSDYKNKSVPKAEIPYYSSKITVEFIPGPEWDWLSDKEQQKFLSTSFNVNSKSNRMGIRLGSDIPIEVLSNDMRSSGVIPGIIQLPPNGKPIILMKDAQTIGGYPRIGKVLDVHLNRLAQVPPNGIIRFKKSEIY